MKNIFNNSMIELWSLLEKKRRKQFKLILILMIITSLTEVLTIGAIIPFLAVITTPNKIFDNEKIMQIIEKLGVEDNNEIILTLTFLFASTALLSGVARLLLLWAGTKISHLSGADLSYEIYRKTIYQNYSVHLMRNSSEVISVISSKVNIVINNLMHILNLITSAVLLSSIIAAMLYIEATGTLIAIITIGLIYLVMLKLTKEKSKYNSYEISVKNTKIIKILQESLIGIREIIINGTQERYCKIYKKNNISLRKAQNSNSIISSSPRTVVETLSIIIICFIAYILTKNNGNGEVIPILGSMALGAQRMLPAIQQIYSSMSSLRGDEDSLKDTLKLLKQEVKIDNDKKETKSNIKFENKITFQNLSFQYENNNQYIFKNVNFEIYKGEKIGLVGVTGSGKTTLIDLIMNLLSPTDGKLIIDEVEINQQNQREWQAQIAHVSQKIYLIDATIEENIAFGDSKEEIDFERVKIAAEKAQISKEIEEMEMKYQTIVGEQGVRLSGGQQQRLGIARALYKKSNVLIFDEATSALDNETEKKVMEAINKMDENITMIIIAHRLTTLEKCTKIIKIDKTKLEMIK